MPQTAQCLAQVGACTQLLHCKHLEFKDDGSQRDFELQFLLLDSTHGTCPMVNNLGFLMVDLDLCVFACFSHNFDCIGLKRTRKGFFCNCMNDCYKTSLEHEDMLLLTKYVEY